MEEEFSRLKSLDKYLRSLIENNLWVQVLIALFLGILTGVALGPEMGWVEKATSAQVGNWLALLGNIFLKLVQMIMIPLNILFYYFGNCKQYRRATQKNGDSGNCLLHRHHNMWSL